MVLEITEYIRRKTQAKLKGLQKTNKTGKFKPRKPTLTMQLNTLVNISNEYTAQNERCTKKTTYPKYHFNCNSSP